MKKTTLLACAQMGRFFTYYGIKCTLVLYMVNELLFVDGNALAIHTLFAALCTLGALLGGRLADRVLGLKRTIYLGGVIFVCASSLLAAKGLFIIALGLLILGYSLFSSNLVALFGRHCSKVEEERKKQFTLFYMLQNLGAFLSSLLCPFLATLYGTPVAFLIATIGIISSLVILLLVNPDEGCKIEEQKKESGCKKLFFLYIGALVLFAAAEEQIFSTLMIFTDRSVNTELLGIVIPAGTIVAINPITILAFGSWAGKKRANVSLSLSIVASCFLFLAFALFLHLTLSIILIMAIVAFISFAELLLLPHIYSYAAKISSKDNAGSYMGLLSLAHFLAILLSGVYSKLSIMTTPGGCFTIIAALMLAGALALKKRKYEQEKRVS